VGQTVERDVAAGKASVAMFENELGECPFRKKYFTEGNHEDRLHRYNYHNPNTPQPNQHKAWLEGHGWKVVPFRQPIVLDGIAYCHFFCKGLDGQVSIAGARAGQPNATTQAKREMRSCIAGHRQGFSFAIHPRGNDLIYSMIAGSFYQHDENYLTPQGHNYWKGCIVLHNVHKGQFSPELYSMKRLKKEFA